MTLSRSSEGHARRASPMPDPDQPTIRDRVLADLAVHAGAFSDEIATRTGLALAQVAPVLSKLHALGALSRCGSRRGYQWALPGVPIEVRPLRTPVYDLGGLTLPHVRYRLRIESVLAFARARHPSRVGPIDVAAHLRVSRDTAERWLGRLADDRQIVKVYRNGRSTGRYRLPEPGEFEGVPGFSDDDLGAPPSPGDCNGGGR